MDPRCDRALAEKGFIGVEGLMPRMSSRRTPRRPGSARASVVGLTAQAKIKD
jgi:hypothetical protein